MKYQLTDAKKKKFLLKLACSYDIDICKLIWIGFWLKREITYFRDYEFDCLIRLWKNYGRLAAFCDVIIKSDVARNK